MLIYNTLNTCSVRMQWSREAYECSLRRRRKEEELRQREEQMVRLHQEAIAESAVHAMHLEADMNAGTSADLQSLSKELETQKAEKEAKPEEPNEMVWHPYVPKRTLMLLFSHYRVVDSCADISYLLMFLFFTVC